MAGVSKTKTLSGLSAVLLLGAVLETAPPALAAAAEPQLREDVPDSYTVVEGDTLWDIAGQFLEQPWMWPEVWEVNPQIDNPHLIYPGDVILLSYENGSPVLTLRRGGIATGVPADLPTVRLTPQVRREALRSPIPAIPLQAVNAFLKGKRLIGADEAESGAYFLGTESGRLLPAPGEVVYARGEWVEGVSTYEILRPAQRFVDPETNEEIGVKADLIGEATLLGRENDQASLRIESLEQEVRAGDRFMPRAATLMDATFFPEPPGFGLEARILEIGAGLVYGGQFDTLILDAGDTAGLAPGHLLAVQRPDNEVRDPNTGETLRFSGARIGTVLVYRVFERASLGLVLESEGPVRMNDRILTP